MCLTQESARQMFRLAPTSRLLVNRLLHQALVYLLSRAARHHSVHLDLTGEDLEHLWSPKAVVGEVKAR